MDGNFSTAEWACASTYSFSADVSGGATPAKLYVMNDGSTLYLAVRLQRRPTDKVNALQLNFDNNNSWTTAGTGASEAGDDVLSLDAANRFTDAYLTPKCTTSGQSACWAADLTEGGTNDGSGILKNDGAYTTYEISHPLNSADDRRDFSLGRRQGRTVYDATNGRRSGWKYAVARLPKVLGDQGRTLIAAAKRPQARHGCRC